MYVVKRDGRHEAVSFDKILIRIKKLCWGFSEKFVDPVIVAQKVIQGVFSGVCTHELDELAAETAANMISTHYEYGQLAARISVSNLHKSTSDSFFDVITKLYKNTCEKTGEDSPLIASECYKFIEMFAEELNLAIDYARDYQFDFFGFRTLKKSYLLKIHNKVVERPQHLFMRVACGIHYPNLDATLESYELMSKMFFTHASPTLFHAASPQPQLASCFLLTIKEDSISGIYDTLKSCAMISKQAGGVGLAIHSVRARGSYIRGTCGFSEGIVPMLRNFNTTALYVNQNGRRKGSFAIYLEPWHADMFEFVNLKKNTGLEENRARDLFYGLWIPDLFMKRVESDLDWCLFCPNEAKGLADVWGNTFEELYCKYEQQPQLVRKKIPARHLWRAILDSQTETGLPYMCYKDACNAKSNQQHLGTIRSSNLCTEIIEYTAPNEIAVCNLSSIALAKFVVIAENSNDCYDFNQLYEVTKVVTRNLNKLIDVNAYPTVECEYSNKRNRPTGIGVQGLANVFLLLHIAFDSKRAAKLNREIFETIYFAACTASMELAMQYGAYPTFQGSPMSQGKFQFDLWPKEQVHLSGRWDWESLRKKIQTYGMYNSLLTALMPTASTSQILGNNECFEPYSSNLYVRRTLAGEFVCVSQHLMNDLIERNLWNETLKDKIIMHGGSVQQIDEIPADLKAIHKTVWEISSKVIIDMAADRAVFIDQSQSLNIHMKDVSYAKLTSMHFYGWKKGLKTGMYYLRTRPAVNPIPFSIDEKVRKEEGEDYQQRKNHQQTEVNSLRPDAKKRNNDDNNNDDENMLTKKSKKDHNNEGEEEDKKIQACAIEDEKKTIFPHKEEERKRDRGDDNTSVEMCKKQSFSAPQAQKKPKLQAEIVIPGQNEVKLLFEDSTPREYDDAIQTAPPKKNVDDNVLTTNTSVCVRRTKKNNNEEEDNNTCLSCGS